MAPRGPLPATQEPLRANTQAEASPHVVFPMWLSAYGSKPTAPASRSRHAPLRRPGTDDFPAPRCRQQGGCGVAD